MWAGLHGFAALNQDIAAFPWQPARDYVERMIDVHVREPARSARVDH
jgi:hypothetical protein